MDELYKADVLEWSEYQAQLLRRHVAGHPDVEMLDWTNIIKEVESVGRNQLSAVQSLLVQALLHDLKAEAWPLSPKVPHWRAKGRGLREDAAKTITTTMALRIDLSGLYADALHQMPEIIDGQAPLPVPIAWPQALEKGLGYFTVIMP